MDTPFMCNAYALYKCERIVFSVLVVKTCMIKLYLYTNWKLTALC